MMMGSAATFIDCDDCWKLLLVTRKGSLYVWDLFNRSCLLHDSLASLIPLNPNSSTKDSGKLQYLLEVLYRSGMLMPKFLFSLFFFSFLFLWLPLLPMPSDLRAEPSLFQAQLKLYLPSCQNLVLL